MTKGRLVRLKTDENTLGMVESSFDDGWLRVRLFSGSLIEGNTDIFIDTKVDVVTNNVKEYC